MKARTLFLTLALFSAGAAAAFAQSAHMGTWKLDEAKSQIPAGIQKNTTVTYETTSEGVKVTTDGMDGKGMPVHTEWTGKFDGKDYPLAGDPTADTRAYKMVDDHTLSMSNSKDGKPTVTGRIVVAPDGQTRTLTATVKEPDGKSITETAVYTKQ